MSEDVVVASTWGRCIRQPRPPERHAERYAIVASDGGLLAELRWQGGRYVLLPCAERVWCSGWLSEVSVWLRRLTRLQSTAPRSP